MAIKPLPTERFLLTKISEGDQRSFNKLFEAYYNVLGDYVLKITKSLEASEEIVQDVFVKVWLQRSELSEILNFSNYIFILCRNQTLDYLRRQAKERTFNTALESHLQESIEIDQMENPAEIYRALIDQAVARMPSQAKKVYVMSRYDRLKHDEIAIKLGISIETVKKHIQYAVNFIKRDINDGKGNAILLILLSPRLFL